MEVSVKPGLAHNEMHRYTRTGGKQDGIVFSDGTLAEGMQEAIEAVKLGPLAMIEGWKGKDGERDKEL